MLADVLVALFVIGAFIALYRFGVMAWIERTLPLEDAAFTALRRTGVTASLFIGYWAVARYYERRRITELAFAPLAISISAFFGVVLIGITIVSLFALNSYRLVTFRGFSAALPIVTTVFLGVVFEELVFRGTVFRILERHAGTAKALIAQALVFGSLHLFNDGTTAMTVLSVTLLGAFWTFIYVYSRNLWVVVANHFTWNLTIFVSGVPLSGQEAWRESAPFESSSHGPAWWTGGNFGPEDSLINILVMAGVLGVFAYWTWRQGRFLTGRRDPTLPSYSATRSGTTL